MSKIAIVFGSSTGETEKVAENLKTLLGNADLYNAESVETKDLQSYDLLIFGASTTGVGDLQDDWEGLLPKVEKMDFSGKKVALFGLGDSASFSTSFAGSMYHLYKALKGKADIIGSVSTDGYTFDESDSVVNGKFVGLPIDQDNESDKTADRLSHWAESLKVAL